MKLKIYKGFETSFLEKLDETPLIEGNVASKVDVLSFDKKTRKKLERELLDLEESDVVWITYQEYSLIKGRVDEAVAEDGLEVVIYRNNLFPDYYPIEFDLTEELAAEIEKKLEGQELGTLSDDCTKFLTVYNALVHVDGKYYGSFFNYEYEKDERITVSDFYPSGKLSDGNGEIDFQIYLNEDIETYLRDLADVDATTPKAVGIQTTGGDVSNRILNSFLAYCQKHGIRALRYYERLEEDIAQEAELIRIAQEDINIEKFKEFRTIPFYKNPDLDKEVVEISQGQIIREII